MNTQSNRGNIAISLALLIGLSVFLVQKISDTPLSFKSNAQSLNKIVTTHDTLKITWDEVSVPNNKHTTTDFLIRGAVCFNDAPATGSRMQVQFTYGADGQVQVPISAPTKARCNKDNTNWLPFTVPFKLINCPPGLSINLLKGSTVLSSQPVIPPALLSDNPLIAAVCGNKPSPFVIPTQVVPTHVAPTQVIPTRAAPTVQPSPIPEPPRVTKTPPAPTQSVVTPVPPTAAPQTPAPPTAVPPTGIPPIVIPSGNPTDPGDDLPEKGSQCDKELAYCMSQKDCTQEGGTLTGSSGCKNKYCCRFDRPTDRDYDIVLLNPMEIKMDKSQVRLESRRRRIPNLQAVVQIKNIKRDEYEQFYVNWNDYKDARETVASEMLDYITYIPNYGSKLIVSFEPQFRYKDPLSECSPWDTVCLMGNRKIHWTQGTKATVTLRGCDKPASATFELEGDQNVPEVECYMPPLARRQSHTLSAEIQFINQDVFDPEWPFPQTLLFASMTALPDGLNHTDIVSSEVLLCDKATQTPCTSIPVDNGSTVDNAALAQTLENANVDPTTKNLGCTMTLKDGTHLTCDRADFVPNERLYLSVERGDGSTFQAKIVTESYRADLDKNGIVNGQDLTLLVDDTVYQKGSAGDINGDKKTDAVDYTLLIGSWGKQQVPQ